MDYSNSDISTQSHTRESTELHTALRALSGSRGVELSEFISNTSVHATGVRTSSPLEVVLETTKTLMTLFNRPGGPKSIGFWTGTGLPRFMAVLDVFGKRGGFHSENPALIRELCSSFYGPVDCGFGNGSTMRHTIDTLSRQADASGNSLVLVISAPWGGAIGDRFWRLCSVRSIQASPIKYVDSDVVLCSMQRPPAVAGSSVLGPHSEHTVSNASVNYMLKEWHAVDINDKTHNEPNTGASEESSYDSEDKRMLKVMSNLIKTLKTRDKEQQARITELETSSRQEIDRCIDDALQRERVVWTKDVECIHEAMENQSREVDTERVRVDALRAELHEVDDVATPKAKKQITEFELALSNLRGKLLVLEEELKACKSKLVDSRKRDNEVRRERSAHEALVESKVLELAAVRTELETSIGKLDTMRRTTSDQVAQLLDKNVDAGRHIERLKADAVQLKQTLCEERSEHALAESTYNAHTDKLKKAIICVTWVRALLTTRSAKESAEDSGTTPREAPSPLTTSVEPTVATPAELKRDELLNIVASTKGLIAHLNSFVEKVQTDPTPKPVAPQLPERTQPIRYENYYDRNMMYPYVPGGDATQIIPRVPHQHSQMLMQSHYQMPFYRPRPYDYNTYYAEHLPHRSRKK